ncbi:hypothetical protein [Vineibacter terrae]|uniref:hypothetical protein n=1 Tax=Vineibacter terrae TaxID=2586908 RepID=UPI002E2F6567|nr:hypothetical protein [Vineibacter terrae]HEX2886377.1 hypothetical protein [Vineibacter terrae]
MIVKATTWSMGVIAAVIVGAPAQAEIFKDKGGQGVYQQVSATDTKLPDGSVVRVESFVGWFITEMPAPYDFISERCNGTVTIAADGKPVVSRGHCEVSSMKGDKAAFWYSGVTAEGGGKWGWMSGSGAFNGINGGGTYKVKAFQPGAGLITEWVGSWETTPQSAAK